MSADSPDRVAARARGDLRPGEEPGRLGWPFVLTLAYLWFEYGRPANPLHMPMVISTLLFLGWLAGLKRWPPQFVGFWLWLAVMALGTALAANTYSAFWTTYTVAILLVTVCIPMSHVLASLRRLSLWMDAYLAVCLYVGIFSLFHAGFGPSRSGGAQDENYISIFMSIGFSFAFFGLIANRGMLRRGAYAACIGVTLAAVVNSFSRGGFIGLGAVGLYCLARGRRTRLGVLGFGGAILVLAAVAGPAYWTEIRSSSNYEEGTAALRLDLWKIGLRMFADYPLLGVGPDNFRWSIEGRQSQEQFGKYGRALQASVVAHNMFMELLSEMGLAGVAIFLAILYRTRRDLAETRREARSDPSGDGTRIYYGACALEGGIIGCLAGGLFVNLLYFSYLWILVSAAVSLRRISAVRIASAPSGAGEIGSAAWRGATP